MQHDELDAVFCLLHLLCERADMPEACHACALLTSTLSLSFPPAA
ncbi:hypothetical protein A2U01_0078511, partial [Trifolium medium]|nr:hypothetical protein [Trifolium medium]